MQIATPEPTPIAGYRNEPVPLEVLITVAAGHLFDSFFRGYVDRLPLQGYERVLELGPSAGNSTRHLARRLALGGGSVTAVDISHVWVEVARQRLSRYANVRVLCGDIATLGLADASFDIAFLSFVLHDIPVSDRIRVMRHFTAKLTPCGALYIREPLRFIARQEIVQVLDTCGLVETHGAVASVRTQGNVYEGIYRRAA
ncbi:MAG: class I SAM-dependent methyltransferase [Anaerolineae bacterium]